MNAQNADTNGHRPTVISIFAGCGGSSLGYKWAGFRELLAIDFDRDAVETFGLNFPEIPIWQRDIKTVAATEIVDFCEIEEGQLDVLDGSPPCQGFSTAGKRRVNDERNDLFREYARLIDGLRPKVFVMENVSGMAKGKMRGRFIEIMKTLKSLGYSVKCKLMNAMWYGVPQSRERLIWVGVRGDLGLDPSFPQPTVERPVSAGEALMMISGTISGWRGDIKNARYNNEWRSSRLPGVTLNASQRPIVRIEVHPVERHAPHIIEAWRASAPGTSLRKKRPFVGSFQSVRLDPNRPSSTQIGAHRNWKWDEARYLTIEEAKILQSFPPEFMVNKYRLIGNSVPPKMIQMIAERIKGAILGKIAFPDSDDSPSKRLEEKRVSEVSCHV